MTLSSPYASLRTLQQVARLPGRLGGCFAFGERLSTPSGFPNLVTVSSALYWWRAISGPITRNSSSQRRLTGTKITDLEDDCGDGEGTYSSPHVTPRSLPLPLIWATLLSHESIRLNAQTRSSARKLLTRHQVDRVIDFLLLQRAFAPSHSFLPWQFTSLLGNSAGFYVDLRQYPPIAPRILFRKTRSIATADAGE
ncbi:hypothetical protein NMY22_g3938 [Coprinellus aureogranulatus]|nr:hypothetical protein NMY22_g3938 [Coprinellus aureogranulatus]